MSNTATLSVDWLSRNVYYSSYDSTKSLIQISKLNGAFRTTILNNPFINHPKLIAIHPPTGYLFWIDSIGETLRLMRSNLNGAIRYRLIDSIVYMKFVKPQGT